jgi:hypothetical protein
MPFISTREHGYSLSSDLRGKVKAYEAYAFEIAQLFLPV